MSTPQRQRKSRVDALLGSVEVSQNFTEKQRRAALLLAEDELTDESIAASVGVTRRTLANWKDKPGFPELIGDYAGQLVSSAIRLSIAKKYKRLEALDALHTKALEVIERRGERFTVDADSAEEAVRKVFGSTTPPEAATGLLVRKETITASGMTSTEWVFDAALVKEIRELQKQAATELGQWEEKSSVDVSGGISREYIVVRDDA